MSSISVTKHKKFDRFRLVEFFYPSRSRGSPKRACRALGVPVGLAYHRRTKCGAYHQGRRAALVSHHAPACIFPAAWWYTTLRVGDIQRFALMIYTPSAWWSCADAELRHAPHFRACRGSEPCCFHQRQVAAPNNRGNAVLCQASYHDGGVRF